MTRRQRVLRALVAPVLLVLVAGCNSLTPPSYTAPDPSVVTEANLPDCPVAGKPVKGGLPDVTLHCMDGKSTLNLAGLRGPMIVNVWFSDCQPCQTEAPIVEQFSEVAQGKVRVLGIDDELKPTLGLQFAVAYHLHYPSVSDQHADAQAKLDVQGTPSTYFVDAAGKLVGPAQIGPFSTLPQIKAAVKSHLGVSVP